MPINDWLKPAIGKRTLSLDRVQSPGPRPIEVGGKGEGLEVWLEGVLVFWPLSGRFGCLGRYGPG